MEDLTVRTVEDMSAEHIAMTIYPSLFVFEKPEYRAIRFPKWVKESACATHSHTLVIRTPHGIVTERVTHRNGSCRHLDRAA